ncbi:hypothetical protein [Mucilaginibacter pankratovii]|uniref:hypothetical protein n=1 Tax=Mucilaginibacter pankratovii TaxID=2772110 RepID=UPI001745CC48|nr:hypothetical protein [Mucilaginibacter pankratovii]
MAIQIPSGIGIFSNLIPGRYYVKAIGYVGQTIQGDSIATVLRRSKGDNIPNFTINAQ